MKISFFILLTLSISLKLAAQDKVICDGTCYEKCQSVEKISVISMQNSLSKILSEQFSLSPNLNASAWSKSLNADLREIERFTKSLSQACLKDYCSKNKDLSEKIGNGLIVELANPFCELDANAKPYPLSLLKPTIRRSNDKKRIVQMNYNLNSDNLLLLFPKTQKRCEHSFGGEFDSDFSVSMNGISVSPANNLKPFKESGTNAGVFILRRKKQLPRIKKMSANEVQFDLGDGYNATVDIDSGTITTQNVLKEKCSGTVGTYTHKVSKRPTNNITLNSSSINNQNSFELFNSNSYKTYEPRANKLSW